MESRSEIHLTFSARSQFQLGEEMSRKFKTYPTDILSVLTMPRYLSDLNVSQRDQETIVLHDLNVSGGFCNKSVDCFERPGDNIEL